MKNRKLLAKMNENPVLGLIFPKNPIVFCSRKTLKKMYTFGQKCIRFCIRKIAQRQRFNVCRIQILITFQDLNGITNPKNLILGF